MKKLALLPFILALSVTVKAQKITDQEWTKVIASLEHEQWKEANDLSSAFLKKIPLAEQDSTAAALLRYMYMYSESGLMNMRKVSKEEALEKVKGFVGRYVFLPAHPVTMKEGFNSVELVNNKTDTLFITATNQAATSILSFEYIIPKETVPLDVFKNHEGKMCRIRGRIKSIDVQGYGFPRYKIIIEQANLIFDK